MVSSTMAIGMSGIPTAIISPKTDSFNKDSAYVVILDGSIYYDYWDVYHYSYGMTSV